MGLESFITAPTVTPASAFLGIINALATAVAPDLPVGSPGYIALQTLMSSLQPAAQIKVISSRSMPSSTPSNSDIPAFETVTSPISQTHATPPIPAPSPALHTKVAPPTPCTPKFSVGKAPAPTPTDAFKQYCKGRLTSQYDPNLVARKTPQSNKQTPTGSKSTTRTAIAPVFVTPCAPHSKSGQLLLLL